MPVTSFSATQGRRGDQTVTPWIEMTVSPYGGGSNVVYKWAKHDTADSSSTFGEYKQGRVRTFGAVRRALSDRDGQYEAARFGWSVHDLDGLIATALESTNNRWLWQRSVEVKLLGSAGRVAADTPMVVARGLVTTVDPSGARTFDFEAEDLLSAEFGGLALEATFPRRTITSALFPDASPDVLGLPQPIIFGDLTDAGDPTPSGVVPTIPVGTEVISAVTWTRLLVCGHACKAVSQVYVNGANASARYGVDVLAPGQTGWPFATSYRDIGGERLTLLYVKGDAQAAIEAGGSVTCNVQGCEVTGDGTGALIGDVAWQYYHCMVNFVVQDYRTGNFLTNPPFVNPIITPTTNKISYAAFGALGALHVARRPGLGYQGAGIVGLGAFTTVRDLIASFNRSCDCESGFDRDGQYMVTAEPVTTPALTVTHTQTLDVLRDSFRYTHDVDGLVNEQPFVYARSYTEAKQSRGGLAWHQGSVDAYRMKRRGSELVLDWIRDQATAQDLLQYRLTRTKDPQRLVRYRTPLHGVGLELGDVIGLTHRFGTGASGWTDRPVRVLSVDLDLDALSVEVTAKDLGAAATPGSVSFGAYATRTDAPSLTLGSSGVAVPVSIVTILQPQFCGGSRRDGVRATTDTDVQEHVDVRIDWDNVPVGVQAYFDVQVWTRNAGTSATPTIYDVTSGATFAVAGTATTAVATAPNKQTLIVPRPGGAGVKWYRLRVRASNVNAAVHALGACRLAP